MSMCLGDAVRKQGGGLDRCLDSTDGWDGWVEGIGFVLN